MTLDVLRIDRTHHVGHSDIRLTQTYLRFYSENYSENSISARDGIIKEHKMILLPRD